MNKHEFTLYFRGPDALDDANLERLGEAGFTDGTFGERDGVQYVSLHRTGPSFPKTLLNAIHGLEQALPGLKVVGLEGEELVTASEIAARIKRSRESVRLLIQGRRGPGEFPPAVPWLTGRKRLYDWAEVVEWFVKKAGQPLKETGRSSFIAAVNGALAVRYRASELSEPGEREAVAEIVREDEKLFTT
ncbi:MAG: hypothetical protein AABM42_07625 [Actinomycetota bacterium]